MAVSESKQKELARIKKNIESSYMMNIDNVKRYHEYRKYTYKTSISDMQKQALASLRRPLIEFNIQPAYIARLMGEFAKHEPSINVTPSEGIPVPHEVINTVEGHLRHVIYEANKNSFSSKTFQDCLTGGFSVFKVFTDYANPMSFKQIIKWQRCFDPSMCGFDPMAKDSHKGDGNYSFEIFPLSEEDFKRRYPEKNMSALKYSRNFDKSGNLGGFNWSYKDALQNKIILLSDYYEKKRKKIQIVQLANGQVLPLKKYEKEKANWNYIEQIPIQLGEPRWTEVETVCRYVLIENEILEYEETDYRCLPHVFMSGSSIELTEGTTNTVYEMTVPYTFHSRGAQELKNFAGQSLANYLENQIQHKFIVKKEALPQEQDYLEALNDIQHASTIVVNAFNENNPEQPINEPIREVVNAPAPPEIMNAFQVSDTVTQTILGSFASNLGQNDNDLSGKAVIESASVGNSAAMPYVMGYLAAIKQASLITVDLMPKYLLGEREIPVVNRKGEKSYQKINGPQSPSIDYEEGALHVDIEPGVSFQVQKSQAMQQIIALMSASEQFAAFMNSEEGLPILLKNLTIHGSDEIQEAVPIWLQKQQQMQQQQMQMQQEMMQNNPQMIRAQADVAKVQNEQHELQMKQEQNEFERNIKMAELAIEQERVQNEAILVQHEAEQNEINSAVQREKAQAEIVSHSLDAAAKIASIKHQERMGEHESIRKSVQLHHELKKGEKENEEV